MSRQINFRVFHKEKMEERAAMMLLQLRTELAKANELSQYRLEGESKYRKEAYALRADLAAAQKDEMVAQNIIHERDVEIEALKKQLAPEVAMDEEHYTEMQNDYDKMVAALAAAQKERDSAIKDMQLAQKEIEQYRLDLDTERKEHYETQRKF